MSDGASLCLNIEHAPGGTRTTGPGGPRRTSRQLDAGRTVLDWLRNNATPRTQALSLGRATALGKHDALAADVLEHLLHACPSLWALNAQGTHVRMDRWLRFLADARCKVVHIVVDLVPAPKDAERKAWNAAIRANRVKHARPPWRVPHDPADPQYALLKRHIIWNGLFFGATMNAQRLPTPASMECNLPGSQGRVARRREDIEQGRQSAPAAADPVDAVDPDAAAHPVDPGDAVPSRLKTTDQHSIAANLALTRAAGPAAGDTAMPLPSVIPLPPRKLAVRPHAALSALDAVGHAQVLHAGDGPQRAAQWRCLVLHISDPVGNDAPTVLRFFDDAAGCAQWPFEYGR